MLRAFNFRLYPDKIKHNTAGTAEINACGEHCHCEESKIPFKQTRWNKLPLHSWRGEFTITLIWLCTVILIINQYSKNKFGKSSHSLSDRECDILVSEKPLETKFRRVTYCCILSALTATITFCIIFPFNWLLLRKT